MRVRGSGSGTRPTACPHLQAGTTLAARLCSRARWAASWPSPNAGTAASAAALSSATRVSTGPQPPGPPVSTVTRGPRHQPRKLAWPLGGSPVCRRPQEGPGPPTLGVPQGVFSTHLLPCSLVCGDFQKPGWAAGGDGAAQALAQPQLPCADRPPPPPTLIPGAVCKFCQPRESELYQKEVRGQGRRAGQLGVGWGRAARSAPAALRCPT